VRVSVLWYFLMEIHGKKGTVEEERVMDTGREKAERRNLEKVWCYK